MMTYMSLSVAMIDLGNLRYAAKYFPQTVGSPLVLHAPSGSARHELLLVVCACSLRRPG